MISSMASADAVDRDDDRLYEVIAGRRTEAGPMGIRECRLATEIWLALETFARSQGVGRAFVEGLVNLGIASQNQRRPDVSFVSFDKWPASRPLPSKDPWSVVPELAIEVVSRTNTSAEVLGKLADFFAAGVSQVWLVYPDSQQIYVYDSPTAVHIFASGDRLSGVPVLPGFSLDVGELFSRV